MKINFPSFINRCILFVTIFFNLNVNAQTYYGTLYLRTQEAIDTFNYNYITGGLIIEQNISYYNCNCIGENCIPCSPDKL